MSVRPEWGNFMRRLVPGALLASALSAGLAMFGMAPAGAAAVSIATGQAGPVTANPANTPQLNANGSVEQVRQLVQCGSTMYAVGTFTSIKHNSTVYTRNNVVSFGATAPYNVTSWSPNVNGIVNSIAFNGTNCADAYIGGKFTAVNGTKVANLAEVSTSGTGALVTAFGHTANGQVETLLGVSGHILAGGYYTTINGSTKKYMTSLSPTTGKDDGFISLNISGNYNFPARNNPHAGVQPGAQPRRHARPGDGRLHLRGRPAQAADLHAQPGHQPGDGDRLDLTGVGRQPGRGDPVGSHPRLSVRMRHERAVLHPGGGLVAD